MAYWRQLNKKVCSLVLTTYLPPPAGMWHWKIGDFNAIYSEAENICANKPSLDELWAISLNKFRKESRTSTKRLSSNDEFKLEFSSLSQAKLWRFQSDPSWNQADNSNDMYVTKSQKNIFNSFSRFYYQFCFDNKILINFMIIY